MGPTPLSGPEWCGLGWRWSYPLLSAICFFVHLSPSLPYQEAAPGPRQVRTVHGCDPSRTRCRPLSRRAVATPLAHLAVVPRLRPPAITPVSGRPAHHDYTCAAAAALLDAPRRHPGVRSPLPHLTPLVAPRPAILTRLSLLFLSLSTSPCPAGLERGLEGGRQAWQWGRERRRQGGGGGNAVGAVTKEANGRGWGRWRPWPWRRQGGGGVGEGKKEVAACAVVSRWSSGVIPRSCGKPLLHRGGTMGSGWRCIAASPRSGRHRGRGPAWGGHPPGGRKMHRGTRNREG